jgi:SAM-dependent methyltransferase
VLEHTRDPWRVLQALEPHLAPGGAFVISIPNLRHVRPLLKIVFDRFEYEPEGILDRTHLRFFTLHTLKGLLASAGLVITRFETNRTASWRHSLVAVITFGLARPFFVTQFRVVARRASEVGRGGTA